MSQEILVFTLIGTLSCDWYYYIANGTYGNDEYFFDLYREKYFNENYSRKVYYINLKKDTDKFFVGIGVGQYVGLICYVISVVSFVLSYNKYNKKALKVNRIFSLLMALFEIFTVFLVIFINSITNYSICNSCRKFIGKVGNGYSASWGPGAGWFFGLATILLCIANNVLVYLRFKEIHKNEQWLHLINIETNQIKLLDNNKLQLYCDSIMIYPQSKDGISVVNIKFKLG
ncbi:hypothetical protein PPL_04807 [Heterostelium album PN500]|uniref:Uncharacterized protein n=1 Tax=Heterostelium pallidum (strain ATCC 26659 / Pp 5 / PN500) TaxID=670386 RepID=D3B8L4_HETP5|nr:hypothetical protein PPL_04807 [Heterostelium album PN500]EFA82382.1 hypothetical protein PPL_04807 [Heterostelium album PN500]|eukprot:XP_020434499.1 hypothetical protein PPL_04807 [Heterostelium album PN500]